MARRHPRTLMSIENYHKCDIAGSPEHRSFVCKYSTYPVPYFSEQRHDHNITRAHLRPVRLKKPQQNLSFHATTSLMATGVSHVRCRTRCTVKRQKQSRVLELLCWTCPRMDVSLSNGADRAGIWQISSRYSVSIAACGLYLPFSSVTCSLSCP